jgi:hypothetical protein
MVRSNDLGIQKIKEFLLEHEHQANVIADFCELLESLDEQTTRYGYADLITITQGLAQKTFNEYLEKRHDAD